ncbi:hypothetical protein Y032_0035g3078 [Ancylostoma ceylanicum]|uniref:Uncharacterized protein n=1 Tax=Ancylostoma ceylanicum TaxID=53326 RepID=A0A016UM43_9BILA|nr:hypothetical protein Y032_0035g3078 [Ancylostoma ceylanicum]
MSVQISYFAENTIVRALFLKATPTIIFVSELLSALNPQAQTRQFCEEHAGTSCPVEAELEYLLGARAMSYISISETQPFGGANN